MMNDHAKAVIFGFSFRHHGPHTAFHGLARALSDQIVIDATTPWPIWTPHALEWRMSWRWLYYSEYRLRCYYRRRDPMVMHYFFPENTMFRAHEWKRHHRLIATCHQPYERLKAPRTSDPKVGRFLAGVRSADAVVVQCASHVEQYREIFPASRLENIPLGVDTDFFRPHGRVAKPTRPRILTVGNWLRDYGTWAQTLRRLQTGACDADFIVVANPDTQQAARNALGGDHPRVQLLSGLSDEALRDEYETASVFFLPLTHAMANDALLEALALATPIVVTDLPATRDYAGPAARYVPPGDPEQAAAAILDLLGDTDGATRLGRAGRARAESVFSWPVVADQYLRLYHDIRNA